MTDETITVHNDDGTDWKLLAHESDRTEEWVLEAAKPIPYDGVLYLSTETRQHVSYRKNSQYNLDVSEVVSRYEDKTGAEIQTCKMCSWPVGSHDPDATFRSGRFCSVKCDVKYDHIKADADAAEREEPTRSEPADFGGGESTGVQDL